MQLEVGKFYKARSGYKSKVVSKNTKGDIFIIETEEQNIFVGNIWMTTSSGRVLESAQHKHDYDLIEEWVEPVVHKFWVNVYPESIGGSFDNFKEAKKSADDDDILATIGIEIDMSKPAGQRVREIVEG